MKLFVKRWKIYFVDGSSVLFREYQYNILIKNLKTGSPALTFINYSINDELPYLCLNIKNITKIKQVSRLNIGL